MTTRNAARALAITLALSAAPFLALGQASAPAPLTAASATPRATGPRLLTPEQSRDSATAPGDLRPERPVTPQISIPFGKAPPAPSKSTPRPAARGTVPAAGGIDDAAARCEAQLGEQVRAKCRDKLAREARAR